ncbi:MAG: Coq4 family protein [Pseudomonadota bacterium]
MTEAHEPVQAAPVFTASGLRDALQPHLQPTDSPSLEKHARQMNEDAESRAAVCGALNWTAFSAPAATTSVYDAIANGVLGSTLPAAAIAADSVPLPDRFWTAYAEVLTGPPEGYDAGTITAAVASLGGAVHEDFGALAEAAAQAHPGAERAAAKPVPKMIALEELASCPETSLGNTLYRMLVENNFDPEVLDREAIGLAGLTPALRYVNTRILQMHDVWHLVAGYETTSLHEIAISAFQLAQFGHNYSGMFLATVATRSHLSGGVGFEVLFRTVAEAWQHGRQTTPFMDIDFETHWPQPIEEIRRRFAIEPYAGTYPADLFEQLAAAGG